MKLSWLIPQEKKFFDLLEQYAALTQECAKVLYDLFTNFDKREEKWREIKRLEQEHHKSQRNALKPYFRKEKVPCRPKQAENTEGHRNVAYLVDEEIPR